jgi:hypothetical protein
MARMEAAVTELEVDGRDEEKGEGREEGKGGGRVEGKVGGRGGGRGGEGDLSARALVEGGVLLMIEHARGKRVVAGGQGGKKRGEGGEEGGGESKKGTVGRSETMA